MEIITRILFWISNGLLVPVIVLLLMLFARALFSLGGFYNDFVSRRQRSRKIEQILNHDAFDTIQKEIDNLEHSTLKQSLLALLDNRTSKAERDRIISRYDVAADQETGKSKLLVRIGPILGLMGTLIPMGPALVGLSTGDIGSMAYNMQMAFASTVIGLLTGAIGFVTLQARQRWYTGDLNELDYLSERLDESQGNSTNLKRKSHTQ